MPDYPDLSLYIDGAWRKTGQSLPVLNPATEAVIGQVPLASRGDLDDALAAADAAFASGAPPRRAAGQRSSCRPPP